MLAEVLLRIAGEQAAERPRTKYRPRPSSAGPERCIRQLTYDAMGIPKPPLAGRAVAVFDDSSWHEELTADLMRKSAFQVHSEQMPVNLPGVFDWEAGEYVCEQCGQLIDRRTAHGHIDWLVTDLAGVDRLIEHKALSHFGFEALVAGNLPADYLTQMAIYMRALQRHQPELREGVLLVKNKNQSAYMELRVLYDGPSDVLTVFERVHHTGITEALNHKMERVTGEAFDRFAKVHAHVSRGTLPPQQYEASHWRCDYCPYRERCWSEYVREQQGFRSTGKSPKNAGPLLEPGFQSGLLETLLREDDELRVVENDAKKARDAVRASIKRAMEGAHIRQGLIGNYWVNWKTSMRPTLDRDLLPPEVVAAATVEKLSETLYVKLLNTNNKKD